MSELQSVVADFTSRLASLIEAEVLARTRQTVLSALGGAPGKRRGRPPKALAAAKTSSSAGGSGEAGRKPRTKLRTKARTKARTKSRKKAPLQLCPVPGCKNPAAPIFGMVCSKHRAVPKALIKKYRAARKASKATKAAKQGKAKQGKAKQAKAAPRSTPKPRRQTPPKRARLVAKAPPPEPVVAAAAPETPAPATP